MSYFTYKIFCEKCGGQRTIKIHDDNSIDWLEDKQPIKSTIISGRKRFDGLWGWQCLCGNNSIMTKQETRVISNPQQPDPQEISDVLKNIKIEPKTGFKMETI